MGHFGLKYQDSQRQSKMGVSQENVLGSIMHDCYLDPPPLTLEQLGAVS